MDYKNLNQELISYLIDIDKFFEDEDIQPIASGQKDSFSLYSSDGRCFFTLDMNRSGIIESKTMLQTRYSRTNDWIIRLELNGPPHTNPDGSQTERDHIHILREKDGKRINMGYNIDTFHSLLFKNTNNITRIFEEFCEFSNVTINHNLQSVL